MIELCSKNQCTGCSSCANICPKGCIEMVENHEGFLYPVIAPESCVQCGLCKKSCPELNVIEKNGQPKIYASWSKADQIRMTSSSGGLFYTLSEHIINKGGVVFGVVFNDDMSASHICAESLKGLRAMQGSKYIQSNINTTYKAAYSYLKKGQPVMFTGTPCQIAGFRAFLSNRAFNNLLLVDIVCHGTPPAKSLKWYLREIKTKIGEFDEHTFLFRNLNAWGYAPSVEVSERRRLMSHDENLFMNLFLKSLLHRESCYQCRYTTTERVSDLTLADFWGIGNEIPFNHDTSKGCSLLLVNSNTGETIINEISDRIFIAERPINEALKVNHQLYMPSKRPKKRDKIFSYIYKHSYDEVNRKYINTQYIRLRHLVGNILRFLKLR